MFNILSYGGRAYRPFLNEISPCSGQSLLNDFFANAAAKANAVGLEIVFGGFAELAVLNTSQSANWPPLIPLFNPQHATLHDGNAFCIFGVDRNGDIVATHAARLFDWRGTDFRTEATSLRLFYDCPDTAQLPGEACIVSAPCAVQLTGNIVYSGAAWVRPDYRGLGLSSVFPRLGKVYADTLWRPDHIISLMTEPTYKKGLSSRTGYSRVEWAVDMSRSRIGSRRFALLSMQHACAIKYASEFLGGAAPQINRAILDGGTEQPVPIG